MGDSPLNPQPNPAEPWLEALTFEQAAQLVAEVSPEVFYQRAAAFDQAGARIQDALDQVRREMNAVREVWTGKAADDFDAVVREVTAKVGGALQHLQQPGYGSTLRVAGDRLADHQRRLRDLQGQKAQQESAAPVEGGPTPEETAKLTGDSAKQIVRDLRTAYWEVGNALPALPYKAPQVVADTTLVDKGQVTQGGPQPVVRTAVGDQSGFGPLGVSGPYVGVDRPVAKSYVPLGDTGGVGGEHRGGEHGDSQYAGGQYSGQYSGGQYSGGQYPGGQFAGGQFSGGTGDGQRFDSQVLGRTDPSAPGWGAPVAPAGFVCGPVGQDGSAVLGQRGVPVRDADRPVERHAGVEAVPGGVLGRPEVRVPGCEPDARGGPGAKAGKDLGKDAEDGRERLGVEDAIVDEEQDAVDSDGAVRTLPDTVSGGVPSEDLRERVRSVIPVSDGPVTLPAPVEAEEIGTSVTADGVVPVEKQPVKPGVELPVKPGVDLPVKPGLELPGISVGSGIAASGVPALDGGPQGFAKRPLGEVDIAAVTPVDPARMGLSPLPAAGELGGVLPAATTGDRGGVVQAFATDRAAGTGPESIRVPGEVVNVGPGPRVEHQSAPMGGMPMSPMMMGGMGGVGGMGGGSSQQGRVTGLNSEARPDAWDPVTGEPIALGRREPRKDPEPCESQEPAAESGPKVDARTLLAERLAELDKALGRHK